MRVRQKAFTLIELLVVMSIIGILSSVVLVNLNGARQKARDVKRVSDIQQIQLALTLYFDANGGKYPKSLTSTSVTSNPSELAPNFIPTIPTPPSGVSGITAYKYVPYDSGGGNCNSYHLGTALEQSSNASLSNDSDSAVVVIVQTGCLGLGTLDSTDFNGNHTTCNGGSASVPDQCFDVTR
ncbi:MAG: type II secretion system protein [Candidatus Taylorbacteria bacterium]|nr:type II secretion system protein [Candidatus Taylorbacteria bacterium]